MKLLSLFDGSGGFPLAGALCGITPVAASEVEPYPIAVTKSRFPNMKHLGDITKINGAKIEPVDVVCFGFPCQDVSVAGKRKSVKHEDNGDEETTRSGLVWEAIRIIKEMRGATNGKYPRFAVFENVPGLFSADNGEAFRTVLEGLIKIVEPTAVMPEVPKKGWPYADCYSGDGWSIAYRVFDAQYIRTAQRRRRIYLVVDFGGQCARKILFERNRLRGYFTQSGTQRKATPTDAEGSVEADDREGACLSFHLTQDPITNDKRTPCISSGNPKSGQASVGVVVGCDVYNFAETGEKAVTLNANSGMSANQAGPTVCYGIDHAITTGGNCTAQGPCVYEDVEGTLKAGGVHAVCYGANAGDNRMAVAYSVENHPNDSRVKIDDEGKVQALTSRMGTGGGNVPMVMEPFCKSARARTSEDATTWKHADVANTFDVFDQGEARANELVVEEHPVICLQGNGIDRADTAGCNGRGWNDKSCYTLNTIDRPAVAYEEPIAIDRAFNQGQNALYDPQTYEDGTNPTLVARGPSAVCYGSGLDSSEVSHTLIARMETATGTTQDNLIVADYTHYIVRRLTPTECARLQGFPDRWGDIDRKDDFTDEEYKFWLDVRNTHAEINGKQVKEYTKKQMLTWYNKLHTDSAEYKLWGNGIALPCAVYVMQGIEDALKGEKCETD